VVVSCLPTFAGFSPKSWGCLGGLAAGRALHTQVRRKTGSAGFVNTCRLVFINCGPAPSGRNTGIPAFRTERVDFLIYGVRLPTFEYPPARTSGEVSAAANCDELNSL